MTKARRYRDSARLRWVRTQGCLVCGKHAQAHHLMHAQPSAMGLKSGDEFAVPLCPEHHHDLHAYGDEKTWWAIQGVCPETWLKAHPVRNSRRDGTG